MPSRAISCKVCRKCTSATSSSVNSSSRTSGPRPSQLPGTIDFGSTNMTGGIEFDVDRGITSSADTRMTMQMNVAAGGQEMSFSIAQHTKLELVEYIRER